MSYPAALRAMPRRRYEVRLRSANGSLWCHQLSAIHLHAAKTAARTFARSMTVWHVVTRVTLITEEL